MALGIAVTLVVGVAHVLVLVSQQCRQAQQQSLAAREVANLLENLAARAWDEVAPDGLPSVELSGAARRDLPDAKVRVEVFADEHDGRRISVAIDWRRASGQGGEGVRLTGWKFRDQEAER